MRSNYLTVIYNDLIVLEKYCNPTKIKPFSPNTTIMGQSKWKYDPTKFKSAYITFFCIILVIKKL